MSVRMQRAIAMALFLTAMVVPVACALLIVLQDRPPISEGALAGMTTSDAVFIATELSLCVFSLVVSLVMWADMRWLSALWLLCAPIPLVLLWVGLS